MFSCLKIAKRGMERLVLFRGSVVVLNGDFGKINLEESVFHLT